MVEGGLPNAAAPIFMGKDGIPRRIGAYNAGFYEAANVSEILVLPRRVDTLVPKRFVNLVWESINRIEIPLISSIGDRPVSLKTFSWRTYATCRAVRDTLSDFSYLIVGAAFKPYLGIGL